MCLIVWAVAGLLGGVSNSGPDSCLAPCRHPLAPIHTATTHPTPAAAAAAAAVLSGWLAYYAYRAVQQGVSGLALGALLGLSAAMSAFLLYNLLAGGNPPPRKRVSAAGAAAAPAASA